MSSGVEPIGTWAPRERRYIVEWAESRFPGYKKYYNVPLGPIPEALVKEVGFEMARRWYRRWRPYADCIIDLVDYAILAEAELLHPKNAIGDLLYYMKLVPKTPDLPVTNPANIKYYLVVPELLQYVKEQCEDLGIIVEVFTPDWLREYYEQWQKYYTPEGVLRRMERKRRLGRL